jgi:hypothetical protein
MELDDLRRQWQQPEPAATSLLICSRPPTQPPGNLIAKMRRNVWGEIIVSVVLACLPLWILSSATFTRFYLGGLVLLIGVLSYYYARQISLLNQMARPDVSIRGHLLVLCAGLRQLLRLYYLLTIWLGPLTLTLILGYYVGQEIARPTGPRWLELGVVTSLVLVLGLIAQFGVIRLTRWSLQCLYGRHLDRLESQLRELDEETPAPAQP